MALNTAILSFTGTNQAAECYTNNAVQKALFNTPRITRSTVQLRCFAFTAALIPALRLAPIPRLQLAKNNQNGWEKNLMY